MAKLRWLNWTWLNSLVNVKLVVNSTMVSWPKIDLPFLI
jgi:hypothetical protein